MNTGLFVFILLCPAILIHAESLKRLLLHDDQSITAAIHGLEINLAKLNASFQNALDSKVAQLNSTFQTILTNSQTSMQSEINKLKAELQAETLKRCQIGKAYFPKCEGVCTKEISIHFNPHFTKAPSVFYAFDLLDVKEDRNIRILANIKDVTTYGATLISETWSDTIVYNSELNWIACPSA